MALSKKRKIGGLNQEFLNSLQNEAIRFLTELQEQYKTTRKTLWQWQMNIPLSERWNKFINTDKDFAKFIKTPTLYKKGGGAKFLRFRMWVWYVLANTQGIWFYTICWYRFV